MQHNFNPVAVANRTIPQPPAEPYIHRPPSITMWNPLNQNMARRGKTIQLVRDAPQIVMRDRALVLGAQGAPIRFTETMPPSP